MNNPSSADAFNLSGLDEYEIRKRIYQAAKKGSCVTVLGLILRKSVEEVAILINERFTTPEGCSLPPLVTASQLGHTKFVEKLLELGADVNSCGRVKYLDSYVSSATALWVSACNGHNDVIKLLIANNADVNRTTDTFSTPLRAACCGGHYETVKLLLENNANPNIATKRSNTCLMTSAWRNHVGIVSILIDYGADVNDCSPVGGNALHFACESGSLESVEVLVNAGTSLQSQNRYGLSPFKLAAQYAHEPVVSFLQTSAIMHYSLKERIEVIELLGAAIALQESPDLHQAYQYFTLALTMRLVNSMPKEIIQSFYPSDVYDGRVECQTQEDLDSLMHDFDLMQTEALLIFERIISPKNPDLARRVSIRSSVLVLNLQFEQSIKLLIRSITIRQENNFAVSNEMIRGIHLFSHMVRIGVQPQPSHIFQMMQHAYKEIELSKLRKQSIDQSLKILMNFAAIFVDVNSNSDRLVWSSYHKQVVVLFGLAHSKNNLVDSNGNTALHLAINSRTRICDLAEKFPGYFPHPGLVRILIHVELPVDAQNCWLQTPLHVIALHDQPMSDWFKMHSIMKMLIDANAHMDYVDRYGKTPITAATTGVAEIILKQWYRPSLRCLCAKAVRKYKLESFLHSYIQPSFARFVLMHGDG